MGVEINLKGTESDPCNACGRPGHQHAEFSRDEIETIWAQGIVLSICDASDPDGSVVVCTTEARATPSQPCDISFMEDISS